METRWPPAPRTLLSSERQIGSSGDRWVDLYFQGVPERGLILFGISRDPALGSPSEPTSVENFFVDDPTLPLEEIQEGPTVEWTADDEQWVSAGIGLCRLWPNGAPDILNARFAALDIAGNFSGWAEVPLEIPSAAEAQVVADAERAAWAEEAAEADRVAAANLAMLADRPSSGVELGARFRMVDDRLHGFEEGDRRRARALA